LIIRAAKISFDESIVVLQCCDLSIPLLDFKYVIMTGAAVRHTRQNLNFMYLFVNVFVRVSRSLIVNKDFVNLFNDLLE
jgi:hypothetical protein